MTAVLMLVALPVLLEGALRLAGVGHPTGFVIREGDYWLPNEKFARQFFGPGASSRPVYFRVPVKKGEGTVRIVVLGESAAMGTPDPAFSFGRVLEVMLEGRLRGDSSPYRKVELVNAAMRGIDSHVVRRIARDCARLEPDVFLIYMGNNEVIGLHGPEPGCSRFSQWLRVIRAGDFLKGTRIGQLIRRSELGGQRSDTRKQDMEFFRQHRLPADDWRREAVRRNFAANLEGICTAGIDAGAHVVLSTVPVNIRDFPPLGWFEGDRDAAAQFRLGQKFLLAGETNKAREHFERALDWDALQFRADTKLNDAVKSLAAKSESERVALVDAVRAFAEAAGGIPGAQLFRDHVHPTFEGDYLLAREFFGALEQKVRLLTPPATNDIPSMEECARMLGYTEWHAAQIQLAMADLTSRPPYHDQLDYRERQAKAEQAARERVAKLGAAEVEAALQVSLAALKRRPENWMLHHNCAQLYQALGRPAQAVQHLEEVVSMFPRAASFQILLGQALAGAGRLDAAVQRFEQAAKLDPEDARARQGLEQLRKYKTHVGK